MRRAAVLLGAALTAWTSGALAQGTDEFGAYGGKERRRGYESPQHAAFELRLGPYKPNVDKEFSGAKPFDQTFGDDTRMLFGIEVDWQALRIPMLGTLGPGVGWGYTRFSADALLADGSGNRSAQQTTLSIMPMYLVGVLRVDVLNREVGIPLVPYGKVGLGYALWWAGDGDGGSEVGGIKGKGSSYGFHYAVGGMLSLDFIDQTSAVEMDSTVGVNNTYVFFEWYGSQLDGFGSGDQMQVGTNTWTLGLALEI